MNIGIVVLFDEDYFTLQRVEKNNDYYEILDSNNLLDITLNNESNLHIKIGDIIFFDEFNNIKFCIDNNYFYFLNSKNENKTKEEINLIYKMKV